VNAMVALITLVGFIVLAGMGAVPQMAWARPTAVPGSGVPYTHNRSYATIVYRDPSSCRMGDEYCTTPEHYACTAAILGEGLRLLDPESSRTAIVTGLGSDAREILASSWTLFEVPPWWSSSVAPSGTEPRHGGSAFGRRHGASAFGRKASLWRLPFELTLFIDADQLVLPPTGKSRTQRKKRLDALWRQPLASDGISALSVFGPPRHVGKCFNGGTMLLRPDPTTASKLAAAALLGADADATRPIRCLGRDQVIMNSVLGARWTRINESDWSICKPHLLSQGEGVRIASAVEAHADTGCDAVHIYLSMGRSGINRHGLWDAALERLSPAVRSKCAGILRK